MAFPVDNLHVCTSYSLAPLPLTPFLQYNYAESDYTYHDTVALSSTLPLHAPTPLPGQSPLLHSDPQIFNHSFLTPSQSPSHQSPLDYMSGRDSSQNTVNTPHCYEDSGQITFPTPSELLVELSGRDPNTDQHRVEKKSETRKARRRAVAKSVGFVPTDPSVQISFRYPSCSISHIL